MRLSPQKVAGFLRDPGRTRAVLLYGDDLGLIRGRAAALKRAVVGAADDPFRSVTVQRAEEIAAEMASVSLGGGRRVVRVPDAGEGSRDAVRAALEGPGDALLLLEASGLSPARSRLFKLIDGRTDAVALACYTATTSPRAVQRLLAGSDVAIDEDALAWLVGHLGADTALNEREVEKLALYVGKGGRADLAAVQATVGDAAGLALEDALFAATAGDAERADRALEGALAQGTTPIAAIRAALTHLERLERAALAVAAGATPAEAAKAARVFFRQLPAFTHALDIWTPEAIAKAVRALAAGERDAKRTGVPAATLCRHLLTELARTARSGAD